MTLALTSLPDSLADLTIGLQNEPYILRGINGLMQDERNVNVKFASTMETKGVQLLALISILGSTSLPGRAELEELTENLMTTGMDFRSMKYDVISMQTSVHVQIETFRERKKSNETQIAELNASIDSFHGKINGLNDLITAYDSDVIDLDKASNALEQRGYDLTYDAEKSSSRGWLGALFSIALAPFTGGYSLAAGALFAVVNFNDANDCFNHAGNLRKTAAWKRTDARNLRSQVQTLSQKRSSTKEDISQLCRQRDELTVACKTLSDVTSSLMSSLKLLDRIIDYMQDVELTLKDAKMQGESFKIVYEALGKRTCPSEKAEKYVNELKTRLRKLEKIFLDNGVKRLDG